MPEIIKLDEVSVDELCNLISDRMTGSGAGWDAILELCRRATLPAVPVEALKRLVETWESEAEAVTDWFPRVDSDLQALIDQAERREGS